MKSESFQSEHEKRFRDRTGRLPESSLPKEVRETQDGLVYQGFSSKEYGDRVEVEMGPEVREMFERVLAIAGDVQEAGGRAFLVGGVVRDEILGKPSDDFDLEIFGIEAGALSELVGRHGKVEAVGQNFGILMITDGSMKIDIAVPRREKSTGSGHQDFEIVPDPYMSVKEAARRRELTISSLIKDPLTGEIIDPFGGVQDLRERVLRVTDALTFAEDPLRLLRAAQFVSRFGLKIEPDSLEIMRSMVGELRALSPERFGKEWDKLLVKGDRPSAGLFALHEMGVIAEMYPELAGLHDVEQEHKWHPEGDVWTHTLLGADAGARVADVYGLDGHQKRRLMYSALCHELSRDESGTTVKSFLQKVGMNKKEIPAIEALVKEHWQPFALYRRHEQGNEVTDGELRQLAKRVAPATLMDLSYVGEADYTGRGPFLDPKHIDQFLLPDPFMAGEWLRRRAVELGIEHRPAPSPLTGRELMEMGYGPGPAFGQMIQLGERLRDELGWDHRKIVELVADAKSLESAVESARSLVKKA